MATTLVLNKNGKYESMFISPNEVYKHLSNMYMPDAWKALTQNINRRSETWLNVPTGIEVSFKVDTSVPMNPVRILLSFNNVILVQADLIGLDAIGYACVIGEFVNNAKDIA